MYILAKIQTLVLKKETDTKEKIKTWETDFMLKNGFALPSQIDRDNNTNSGKWFNQIKLINALKKAWQLHL